MPKKAGRPKRKRAAGSSRKPCKLPWDVNPNAAAAIETCGIHLARLKAGECELLVRLLSEARASDRREGWLYAPDVLRFRDRLTATNRLDLGLVPYVFTTAARWTARSERLDPDELRKSDWKVLIPLIEANKMWSKGDQKRHLYAEELMKVLEALSPAQRKKLGLKAKKGR